MTLPQFYPDNVTLLMSETLMVRGNTVSDIQGDTAVGIQVDGAINLRAKENKVVRIRSRLGQGIAYSINNVTDAVFVYNVASRTNYGFVFDNVMLIDCYNATVHLCDLGFSMDSYGGTFRNIAISALPGYDLYRKAVGFYAPHGTVDLDYVLYYGVQGLLGTVQASVLGSNIYEKQLLYMDELNDDLTPDYVSEAVDAGTNNPLLITASDISGIESLVNGEQTADRNYWYELIDNSFWDIDNQYSAEASFIKAFQSRVLAGAQVASSQSINNMYLKTANSFERFSELYPMYARYIDSSAFQKRVMDMFMAGQNVGTTQSYQSAIGGYNLMPSFFKRLEDYEDGWVVGVSYVDYDNYICSYEELSYGMAIDMLGTSMLNLDTFAECYNNTQSTVSDIAPVRWFLQEPVEPAGYVVFIPTYNGFEDCVLTNMFYNDDFGISVYEVNSTGTLITPHIDVIPIVEPGSVPVYPTNIELSLLDRIYSEDITREVYWRQGTAGTIDSQAWILLGNAIGEVLAVDDPFVQFKIVVNEVHRIIDYEFVGLALRAYTAIRDWTQLQPIPEDNMAFIEVQPGAATMNAVGSGGAEIVEGGLKFTNDGTNHEAAWTLYIPKAVAVAATKTLRLVFSMPSSAGTAKFKMNGGGANEYPNPGNMHGETEIAFDVVSAGTGDPYTIFVDIDVTSWILSTDTIFFFILSRDSSATGDTLVHAINLNSGRVLEP